MQKLLFLSTLLFFMACSNDNDTNDDMFPAGTGDWKLVKRTLLDFTLERYDIEIDNPAMLKIYDDGSVLLTDSLTTFSKNGIISSYMDQSDEEKLEVDFYADIDPETIDSQDTFLVYRLRSNETGIVVKNDTLFVSHFITGALVCDLNLYFDKFVRVQN